MTAKKILIVQHMDWEGPGGHLLAALAGAGIAYEIAEAWHRPLPPLDPFAALSGAGRLPQRR